MDKARIRKELRAMQKDLPEKAFRQKLKLARFVTPDARTITLKDIQASVYLTEQEKDGRTWFVARAFLDRTLKLNREWGYRFPTEAKRNAHIQKWHAQKLETLNAKKHRKNVERQLQLGDVLSGSWGYDQTNAEFYEVTKLVGKTMVEIRELATEKNYDNDMSGEVVPIVGQYTGDPVRRKVLRGNCIKLHFSCHLTPAAHAEAGGVKIYSPMSFSSYA